MAWPVALVLMMVPLAACDQHRGGGLAGKASNEWTRTYGLNPGGEFQIVGATGSITVKGSETPSIAVKAERIVKAASDSMAQEMVSKVRIVEDVAPDKVVLRNEGLEGIVLGVEIEVNFDVAVPVGTRLRLHSNNGDVNVSNVDGAVVISSTNGDVTGTALRGGLDVRSTNGRVKIEMGAVSKDPVDVRDTNGTIDFTLPPTANANLDLSTTNGSFNRGTLPMELTGEQTKRRMRARMNDGGTSITLSTTNGNIRLHATGEAATPAP
ncbi:MAG: DUF4097 family beta strand repeat-containing protein [Vicinamibacterales bacterium]